LLAVAAVHAGDGVRDLSHSALVYP
jgi:hypothetical protein